MTDITDTLAEQLESQLSLADAHNVNVAEPDLQATR